MVSYSYKEIINYFAEKLGSNPSQEDVDSGEVELFLNGTVVTLKQSPHAGGFEILISLGFFNTPPPTHYLKELCSANFLGINTGGCTLCLDQEEVALSLKIVTTAGTTPQQNWEALERIVSVAQGWSELLKSRDDFSLVVDFEDIENIQKIKTDSTIRA